MGSLVAESLGMLVAFSAGIFSFLSPCVLPLFPSYLSFITGMSLDQLQDPTGPGAERWKVMAHSMAFIVGFSMVFIGIGASFSGLGQLLIILFGLYIGGALPLHWLGRYKQLQLRSKPAGYLGSWLVGVTFAIGWT